MGQLETLKALSALQLAYPKDFSEQQLDFYVNMLNDIPPDILFAAVRKLINTSSFLPTIAELRAEANTVAKMAAGKETMNADEAWGKVQKAIASVGMYEVPDFDDEILAETVKNLGWKEICQTPIEDTAILRAQFRKAFEQASTRRAEKRETMTAIRQSGVHTAIGNTFAGLLPNVNDTHGKRG